MPGDLARRIEARLAKHHVRATEAQLATAASFIGHLAKWNKSMNLTSLDLGSGLDESLDRLVVEPLLAAETVPQLRGSRVVDLGSGGGSPGIPLAIALDTTNLTLVESKAKKATFLRDVLRELGWFGAKVVQARIQALWSDPAFQASADVVSVRALAMDTKDWQGAANLLASDGRVLWFRSIAQEPTSTGPLNVKNSKLLTGPGSQVLVLGR